jgi:hypothetical protein
MPCRHLAYSPLGDPKGENASIGHPGPTSRVPGIEAESSLQNAAYLDRDLDSGPGDGLDR